ncbi:MAG: peptidase S41, partial [Actinomycetota bacterium]|nr:peptidase S41 [Actinomycetota bacterium]
MTDAYLRFPHLHADLITFVAEDDVWLAPVAGGRAWRVSADQVPVVNPRFSPDGSTLAWASTRDVEPEVHAAPTDGGPASKLTYWGDVTTEVLGWTPDGRVVAATATGQASSRRTWAHAVPLDGSPSTRLPYGPVGALSLREDGAVLLGTVISREPAWWKRYRGGTAGQVWVKETGDFQRILSDVDGHIVAPMWVGDRIAFLSDHDGVGNLYSCATDGTDVRQHSDHEFYARNATTDGARVIYHSGGALWLLDGLDAEPRMLDVKLGGSRGPRQPRPISAVRELGAVSPDHTARGSVVEV